VAGIEPNETELNVTEAEIISMVNEGHEQGVLEEREVEMISNIIELDDKTAGDVMVHRKNIVAVDGTWSLKETVNFIVGENSSRYPVFMETIDNVIGILHIKDVLSFYHKSTYDDMQVKDIPELLREPEFLPESRNLDDLFKEMQANKNHMEIVVDEYGQTAGLVSMEDILEEIVGNILDEHDEEEQNIIQESEDTYLVKGLTTLEELSEVLDITFDEEEFDTINGYMIAKLDRIPAKGETPQIEACGCTFCVREVDGKIITLLEITKNKPAEEDSSTAEE
jgi:putative hemolysin